MSRRWVHIPLHRLRDRARARVTVVPHQEAGRARRISIEGLEWDEVACGVIERGAHPLHPALPASRIREGFVEEPIAGPGWCPMAYRDGLAKRSIIDQLDRYTAVIRMRDNTLVFPEPFVMEPPRMISNSPPCDPATVLDMVIAPGDKLLDRGWMRRDILLPVDPALRPAFRSSRGRCYLSFDGRKQALVMGPLSMPSGPATLEIVVRPRDISRTRTLFDSTEPILSLVLMPGGTLRLIRWNQFRKPVELRGSIPLRAGAWHCVAAVFDGRSLALFIDGAKDGRSVPVHGLRSDYQTTIGTPARWADGIRALGAFRGDLAALRILQRPLTPRKPPWEKRRNHEPAETP